MLDRRITGEAIPSRVLVDHAAAAQCFEHFRAKNYDRERRLLYLDALFGMDSIEAKELADFRVPELASVYVACGQGCTKIGYSRDPGFRAKGLNQSGPTKTNMFWAVDLAVADAKRLERALHRKLQRTKYHVRGEWYDIPPETAVKVVKREIELQRLPSRPNDTYGLLRGL